MKKQLLALAILGSSIASAQTWSQNFSSATPPNIPGGWAQNNVDGFTVTSALSSYSFGTNAWVTRDFSLSDPTHGKVAASTSYYTPAHISNDWLITPSFTVPANAVIEWEAFAPDQSYPDGYDVKISTTGTAVADFSTTLQSIGAENSAWTTRGLSLNAYAGQTVYIAFVNNSNDMYLLFLDNIKVIVPQANDGNLVDITGLIRYNAAVGNQTISGTFKSLGYTTANTAVLNYQINNAAIVTEPFTFGSPLSYAQTAPYSFTTPATFSLGTNKVKAWVTQVNGLNEIALANDTAYSVVYVASTSKPRNALIEEFTSSTCVPCANLNVNFDPLLNSNNPNMGGSLNVIKYQVNWPSPGNDPSYNPHGKSRVAHYAVPYAPYALTNGRTEMLNNDQAEINAAIAEPAFADITTSLNVVGTTISASATITPYVTIANNSPLRVHQALLQRFYNFPNAVTSQKNYHHVMRKMSPDGWGNPVTVTDGVAFNTSFTHSVITSATPVQLSYDFWNTPTSIYEYVVFVQDSVSNDVLQSGSSSFTVSSVGLVDLKADQQIGVYPNPAKDFAAIAINLQRSSAVDISIVDVSGKLVYSNKTAAVEAGKNEIKVNTSEFPTGVYTIIVNTGNGILNEKLIINK